MVSTNLLTSNFILSPSTSTVDHTIDNPALTSLMVTQAGQVGGDVGFGDNSNGALETFGVEEDCSSLPIEDNQGKKSLHFLPSDINSLNLIIGTLCQTATSLAIQSPVPPASSMLTAAAVMAVLAIQLPPQWLQLPW